MKIREIAIITNRRVANLKRRDAFEYRWHRFKFEESYGSLTLTGPNAWSLEKYLGGRDGVFEMLSEEDEAGNSVQTFFDEAEEGDIIAATLDIASEEYYLEIVKDYQEYRQVLGVGFVKTFGLAFGH